MATENSDTPSTQIKVAGITLNLPVVTIIAIILQTVTVAWYFAQQDATIRQHGIEIAKLQSGVSVYISRDQLNDLLGARDEKTANIERSLSRIEGKLDKIIP